MVMRILFLIVFLQLVGCAHNDRRGIMDPPEFTGWYSGSIQDRNTLRAAVYANDKRGSYADEK